MPLRLLDDLGDKLFLLDERSEANGSSEAETIKAIKAVALELVMIAHRVEDRLRDLEYTAAQARSTS